MSSTLREKHLHGQAREMAFNVHQWIKSQIEDQCIKQIKENCQELLEFYVHVCVDYNNSRIIKFVDLEEGNQNTRNIDLRARIVVELSSHHSIHQLARILNVSRRTVRHVVLRGILDTSLRMHVIENPFYACTNTIYQIALPGFQITAAARLREGGIKYLELPLKKPLVRKIREKA
ncbi:hypothetical protein FQA39_LY11650 [Lamprigera yunnana]|nr:hypothetical protein FQA39_LY11650 [Lamprigera yunnana]